MAALLVSSLPDQLLLFRGELGSNVTNDPGLGFRRTYLMASRCNSPVLW